MKKAFKNKMINLKKSFMEPEPIEVLTMEEIEKKKEKCVNCKSENLVPLDNEKITCSDCGAVNGYIINYTQEWRYYGSSDDKRSSDPNRCGAPLNPLLNNSLGTTILGRNNYYAKKINNYNNLSYSERSLIEVQSEIAKITKKAFIPKWVTDKALLYFNVLRKEHIKRAQSRKSIITSCVRYALKEYTANHDPSATRTMQEIANCSDVKEKKLSRGCNQFIEVMYKKNPRFIKKIRPTEPKDLIIRFGTILNLDIKYQKIAIRATILSDKLGICQNNNPKSIAVGSIYLVSQLYKLGLTKNLISQKCGTSQVTISNTYTQMLKYKKYLIRE